ncbi:peptide/nickel transport system permease protein [Thermocatellispora tengchongensis]|uniref:Peptide/nickel transport system permease protein n=1 Tax=Thermocatellispora tengchongensis TaxID=1073253 RepID=A0A840P8S4_9ACTN|nr:ABC transporter permease [Thermocatellispora tengchongensis]MBB5136068.1 peptide/nickel transport system permease protein [Thermocatellispora tengchongensis]
MLNLIVRRAGISVPLLLIVSALTFVLGSLVPGDAARAILGVSGSPEQYAALRDELHLDEPVWDQYRRWLTGAVRGDLGDSVFSGEPVVQALNARLPATLSLVAGTTLVCALVGVAFGTVSAVRGGWIARSLDVLSVAGLALPSFWLALVLVSIFSVWLGLLPATGYVHAGESVSGWLRALVLPVVALALAGITQVARQTRDAMLDVLGQDFIRTMEANGFSRRSIVLKHALRNAAAPILTVLGVILVGALSGTVFVENVFVLPGLGGLAVQATQQHDLPVIAGIAVYFTLITIAVNLLVDLAYGWLNPKVRTA